MTGRGRDEALRIDEVSHSYGGEVALDRVSLSVRQSEFLTLLGPSGCGKTTLLRIMAGFIRPTRGSVFLHGKDVTRLPPYKRHLNMVFQRVTLFPHLDVFDNIAFGLRMSKVPKREIPRRVREALALVRLERFAHRRAEELSGGQAQRVVVARALVNRPEVLLMDEPLSALDLRIRLDMEIELRRVHRETGATFVYVTHDQREALALSDRIAVLDRGRIQQIDAPRAVYDRPESAFTARFVGDANVLPAEVRDDPSGRPSVILGDAVVSEALDPPEADSAWLVVRQEDVSVAAPANGSAPAALRGVIRDVGFRGAGYTYTIEVRRVSKPIKAEVPTGTAPPLAVGSEVAVGWDPRAILLLPREG